MVEVAVLVAVALHEQLEQRVAQRGVHAHVLARVVAADAVAGEALLEERLVVRAPAVQEAGGCVARREHTPLAPRVVATSTTRCPRGSVSRRCAYARRCACATDPGTARRRARSAGLVRGPSRARSARGGTAARARARGAAGWRIVSASLRLSWGEDG